jgi:hypothetical protein
MFVADATVMGKALDDPVAVVVEVPIAVVEVRVTQVPTDAPCAVSVTVINLLPAEEATG